jgi:hypothetical protein
VRSPAPYSLSPFLPQKSGTPTPPTRFPPFFGASSANNKRIINSLHFQPVNESVTPNPVFRPLFNQKEDILAQKSLFYAPPECQQIPQFGILELGIEEPFARGKESKNVLLKILPIRMGFDEPA